MSCKRGITFISIMPIEHFNYVPTPLSGCMVFSGTEYSMDLSMGQWPSNVYLVGYTSCMFNSYLSFLYTEKHTS